jgi:voltage-gated potassium channel
MIVGVVGFMLIEGYQLTEAFYMMVITIATVGFQEVRPLSEMGRIFTSFYIIFNLGVAAYAVGVFTTYLFEGELQRIFQNIITNREVNRMKDHIILCGFGRNGMKAAEELNKSNRKFVIIESDPEVINAYHSDSRYQFILGDATVDDVLLNAGIQRAGTIITTLPRDAESVFISLTARELNPGIYIIARATDEKTEKKLYRAGASRVVLPDALGGLHMAHLVTKPYVIEFLDMLNGVGEHKLGLEELRYASLKSQYRNKTVRELDIRNKTGATVIAIKDNVRGFIFNPNPQDILGQDDILIILGSEGDLKRFRLEYMG